MQHLKQYRSALAMLTIAVIAAVVGGLMLTVFAPAQQVTAKVQSPYSLAMTRDKVLPLKGKQVSVTVTSEKGQPVALVLGTSADVQGWIGDMPYGEIVGLESGFRNLKIDSVKTATAQSGKPQSVQEQSARARAAQSKPDTSAGAAGQTYSLDDLLNNDMWIQRSSGNGQATLKVTNATAGLSVLAAVTPSQGTPTVTLSWVTPQTNAGAIVAWIICLVFLALAIIFAITKYIDTRRRDKRSAKLKTKQEKQSADTEVIDRRDLPSKGSDPGGTAGGNGSDGADVRDDGDAQSTKSDGGHDHTTTQDGGTRNHGRNGRLPDGGKGVDPVAESKAQSTGASQVVPPSAPASDGRTGISGKLPTRRAMQEARQRGEQSVIVDGHEFKTGAIPIILNDQPKNGKGTNK